MPELCNPPGYQVRCQRHRFRPGQISLRSHPREYTASAQLALLKTQSRFLNRSTDRRPERACCERRETPGAAHPIALWRMEHEKGRHSTSNDRFGRAFVVPVFGTESLVRKAVADRSFEAFLPPANFDVPWLTIDKRTKLPKGDSPSAGTQTLDR